MYIKWNKLLFTALITGMLAGFGGCNYFESDDDEVTTTTYSTNVDALSVSSTVSVVEANETSSGTAKVSGLELDFDAIQAAIAVEQLASTTDYKKDNTNIYVREESAQTLNTVNSILCYFGQLAAADMVNRGPYLAQVDDSQCETNKGGSSSDSSSGSSSSVSYSYWRVDSSRQASDTGHDVRVWVEASDDDPQYIYARMIISEGVSDSNSLGIFKLDWVGYTVAADGSIGTDKTMEGFIMTRYNDAGHVELNYYQDMDREGQSINEKAAFVRSTDGTRGNGTVDGFDWSTGSNQLYHFAFDDKFFYRSAAPTETSDVCLDRNQFHETTWRYGMYDSAGARVNLNSGFPISSTATDGTEYHGYIGYWGLWMPEKAGVANGSTVYKEDFENPDAVGDPFTIFQSNGKLKKHTKKTTTLGALKNIAVSWRNNSTQVEYQLVWNGTNFIQKATRSSSTGWQWSSETESTFTLPSGTFDFRFYSESLGGNGQVKFDNWDSILAAASSTAITPTISNTSVVIYHVEDVVFPGDTVPAALTCYDNCPNPAILTSSDRPYFDYSVAAAGISYTFDSTTMMLKDASTDTAVEMTTASSSNQWGVHSGALFENTTANLAKLACPWNTAEYCPWQGMDKLDSYYTWETGPNDWQKFTSIKASATGLVEKFDAPMSVKYTHAKAGDFKGGTFFLSYQGFGNLHGIPEMCIVKSTGQKLNCWDVTQTQMQSGDVRYLRMFVIPNGSLVTKNDSTATEYVIKSLDVEQTMIKVENTSCTSAGLTLDQFALPAQSSLEDPYTGEEPDVDTPSVIAGVLQITLD